MPDSTDKQESVDRQHPETLSPLRLGGLLEELHSRLAAARTPHDRIPGLLDAVLNIGGDLDLEQVLQHIVEAAVVLADAEYGALGVIGEGQWLSRFLPVGIGNELAHDIGPLPSGHGILGELIRHPKPLRLTDLAAHPSSYGFPEHHPPMRTFLGVPIRVRDEVFGNLYLTEKRGGARFDAEDEAMLSMLAVAAGVAIDNARLYHESRRREQWLEALGEITRVLLSGAETGEVLALIARCSGELADADSVAVFLPDAVTGELTATVAQGVGAEQLAGSVVPREGSLAGRAACTGEPAVTGDLATDPRAYASRSHLSATGPAVAVPLRSDAHTRGSLRLSRTAGRQPFLDSDVRLISGFAEQAALALELDRGRRESEQVAALRERDRIAQDLHDLAIQRLFATGMTLQSAGRLIERPEAALRVGRAVDDLDETIKIIRSTIFGLRTAADPREGAGLRRRILDVVGAAGEALGFSPSLRMEGPVDTDVPSATAEHLLAVLTEALSNAARHAHARRVDVALTVADEAVLSVTDDGVGLGAGTPGGGLTNLRSRADLLGGSLRLEAPAQGGIRLIWRVPLSR
ncbi:GAF domain-containing protein [Streptomyces ochraceiscleroticus]|uniref:GAF domain-containing protein n=1 Tax=Streptomyces ochraceiscleroticus TaxID=47761 RepID=A0ABW1MME4_9ACTN|nr:GAF domain-containing protein [Streptomyces ochraceiscleroticus]